MAMLSLRHLVLGRRPQHALHLLCCHLVIGPSRFVGEDVKIRQMPEIAGDAVIRLDIVGDDIRGPQGVEQLPNLVAQNQRLRVCRQEILRLLGIFQHRDRLLSRGRKPFSKGRKHLCLHKGTNHLERRCLLGIRGLDLLDSNFVRGRSKFLQLLLLRQNRRRHRSQDLQEIHGLRKIEVLDDQSATAAHC